MAGFSGPALPGLGPALAFEFLAVPAVIDPGGGLLPTVLDPSHRASMDLQNDIIGGPPSGAGLLRATATVTAVPEPATVTLLGESLGRASDDSEASRQETTATVISILLTVSNNPRLLDAAILSASAGPKIWPG